MSTIVTRAGKGSALTHNEVDANFTNLNTDKVEKTGTDPVVISVNSASDALRITQTGAGNALVVEDSANPDSSPFVVNTNGLVGIGTSSPTDELAVVDPVGAVVVSATGATDSIFRAVSSTTGTSYFAMGDTDDVFVGGLEYTNSDNALRIWANNAEKVRITSAGEVLINGTTEISGVAALTVEGASGGVINLFRDDITVAGSNIIGQVRFFGNDTTGNTPTEHAYIQAISSGTHAPGDNPTDIVFATTPDGSDVVTEAVRIKDGGGLLISRTAVTTPAAGDGNVFSGTYTPTQVSTNVNVAAISFVACQYIRVGNTVTVGGQILFTATASGTDTQVRISLPIASAFTASRQLGGSGAALNTGIMGTNGIVCIADATNDCAELRGRPTTTNSTTYNFSFTYQVL